MKYKNRNFLGISFSGFSMDETIAVINETICSNKKVVYADLNVQSVLMYQENSAVKNFFNSVDLLNFDGQGVVWAYRYLDKGRVDRTTGCDLMYQLIDVAAKNGHKCFFLGAKDIVLRQMIAVIIDRYGSDVIGGFRNGYFSDEDEQDIVDVINDSHVQILFIGITSPKKELFLNRYADNLNVNISMGVGGSFDVYAGVVQRAPVWMQKSGLEWFFRLLQEPKRMWKRYLVGNSKFIWLVIKERFK